jgi:WD40 repeat protein
MTRFRIFRRISVWLIVFLSMGILVLLGALMILNLMRPRYVLYSEKLYDEGTIEALACSPDQALIALVRGSDCCDIYSFDLKQRLFRSQKLFRSIRSITFDRTCKYLVTGEEGNAPLDNSKAGVYFWDVATGKLGTVLQTNLLQIRDISVSPDGKTVAVAGGDWQKKNDKGTVQLFDVEKRESIGMLEGHEILAKSVKFSPDGNVLASAGAKDKKVILWDWRRKKELVGLSIPTVVSHLAFSRNGKYLAAWASGTDGRISDGRVLIFDIEAMELTSTIASNLVRIGGVSFSADSEVLVIGGGEKGEPGEIQFWRISSESLIHTFHYSETNVTGVVCSPDGMYVIASTRDGKVLALDYKKIVRNDK